MSDDFACTHRILVQFDQAEDGTFTPHIIVDPGIGRDPNLNVMFYMAEMDMPMAGLAAQALYELLDSGLVQHAVAKARSDQRGVEVLLPNAPVPEELTELELAAMMKAFPPTFDIH